jgi:hypothetical protein
MPPREGKKLRGGRAGVTIHGMVLIDFIMALAGSFTDKSGAFVLNWNAEG